MSATNFAIDVPQTLIARMQRGDMSAFEQIYRLFERPVFTLSWRLLGSREDAQEALHDSMIYAFEKVAQFRGDAPFWGWLRQITVNTALMRLRKTNLLDFVDELPEISSDAQMEFISAQSTELQRALDGLPTITRSVVWLFYVEGFTHDEIANNFGKSISFSKSQVQRGTQKLRELMNPAQENLNYVQAH